MVEFKVVTSKSKGSMKYIMINHSDCTSETVQPILRVFTSEINVYAAKVHRKMITKPHDYAEV